MKKIVFSVILLVLAAGLVWKLAPSRSAVGHAKPKIVVSGYVPYILVKQLAGNTAEILMLLPPGAEPHSFEPTPGALVALNQADAFIYMSSELEPWAADLAQAAGKQTVVLALADSFSGGQDPHIWMDFDKTGLLAHQLAALLAELAPQNREITDQHWKDFTAELDQLKQAFQTDLTHCKYQEVVHIGHLAFGNLLRPYGVALTALSGTSHEGEHSAKKIAQLVQEIKSKKIPAIFTEQSVSDRLAQTVRAETGVQILPLYSIEHISKKDFEQGATYFELMRRNLESLKRGLECQAF